MTRGLRVLLVALVLTNIAGTPGLGIETRTSGSVAIGTVYGIAFFAAIIAFGTSWRWPVLATRLAVAAGALAAILAVLDLAGVTDPERPVTAMTIVDAAMAMLGVAIGWLAAKRMRLGRAT